MRNLLPLAVMAVLAAPAAATDVVRLSDSQRDAVIFAAANGPERDPVLTPELARRDSLLEHSLYPEFYARGGQNAPGDRKVHGEMTMFAGSGGTVGMSGTAIVPVGKNSTAAISVMQGNSRYGSMSGFGFAFSTGSNSNGVSGSLGYANSPFGYGPYGYGGYGYGGYGSYGLGILGGYGPPMPGFGRFGRHHW